uniref:ACYPI000867 protein n=1 Tax=Acyrthosiphon pisum TaxID=7029 RepID=C4WXM9_ACYPI|nr:ACYPI000867 [Acyrthosiphon pisum]
MLTRRSRKEGIASPSDAETTSKAKRSATPSKRSATPSKSKKPVTRRSKSKSVERRIRTRSRSANKTAGTDVNKTDGPVVLLERYNATKQNPVVKKKEIKNKKAVELVDSNSRKSPTPVKEVNSIISPASRNISDNVCISFTNDIG